MHAPTSYNNNPSEHVTRDFSVCGLKMDDQLLPGCFELMGTFNATTMADFHFKTEFNLHVGFHTTLGGAWDCGFDLKALQHRLEIVATSAGLRPDFFYKDTHVLAKWAMLLWRMMYYDGELVSPEQCLLSADFEDCEAYCPSLEELLDAEEGTAGDNSFNVTFNHGGDGEGRKEKWEGKKNAHNWKGDNFSTVSRSDWDNLLEAKVLKYLDARKMPDLYGMFVKDPASGHYARSSFLDSSAETLSEAVTMDVSLELIKACVLMMCRPGKISTFMDPLASSQDPLFFPLHVNWERNFAYMRVVKNLSTYWDSEEHHSLDNKNFVPYGWAMEDPCAPFSEVYGIPRQPAGSIYTNVELLDLFNPTRQNLPYIWDDVSFDNCMESPAS